MTLSVLLRWVVEEETYNKKSIIRFEAAKERHFAEYYPIGTLTSITFAVITAAFFAHLITLLTYTQSVL